MYADRIAAYRKQKGLSQGKLSELLGVSQTAVYKWESGQTQPDIEMLKKLADLFGVTLDELCDHQPAQTAGEANITVMNRAFCRLTAEEQEKLLSVGRVLFAHAFGREEEL